MTPISCRAMFVCRPVSAWLPTAYVANVPSMTKTSLACRAVLILRGDLCNSRRFPTPTATGGSGLERGYCTSLPICAMRALLAATRACLEERGFGSTERRSAKARFVRVTESETSSSCSKQGTVPQQIREHPCTLQPPPWM